jgi:hypothetical protein
VIRCGTCAASCCRKARATRISNLASKDLEPRGIAGAPADGLDGWSFLMRTPRRDFALAYFENQAPRARLKGFSPGQAYRWQWFDPRNGSWSRALSVRADAAGVLSTPASPAAASAGPADFAAKILAQ